MRLSENWKDYELIDASDGERLERWGNIILIRPDPQIIWSTEKKNPLWYSAHARYHRSNKGGGSWEQYKKIPAQGRITQPVRGFFLSRKLRMSPAPRLPLL